MDNLDEWTVKLKKSQAEALEVVPDLIRALVFVALGAAVRLPDGRFVRITGVILRTPVDTGRARSSINISVGTPDTSVPAEGEHGAPTILAEAGSLLRKLRRYETVWIVTNLVYFEVLEFGGYPDPVEKGTWDKQLGQYVKRSAGGFSKQAPKGVFRITFQELKQLLEGVT